MKQQLLRRDGRQKHLQIMMAACSTMRLLSTTHTVTKERAEEGKTDNNGWQRMEGRFMEMLPKGKRVQKRKITRASKSREKNINITGNLLFI